MLQLSIPTKKLHSIQSQCAFITAASSLMLFMILNWHFMLNAGTHPQQKQEHTVVYNNGDQVDKIAFLFLTRHNLMTPKVWDIFFGNSGDEKYYNIYVHSKYPANISITQPYLYHNKLPQDTVISATARFTSSLVQASNILFKTAFLDDSKNKKFVLLSESHIPLYNFTTIYSKLMDHDGGQSYFSHVTNANRPDAEVKYRYDVIKRRYMMKPHHHKKDFVRKFVAFNQFFPSDQWIILDRHLIGSYLLPYEIYWNRFFKHAYAPDENYYSTLFRKYLNETEWNERIILNGSTYVEFVPPKGHAREWPYVSNDFILRLRKQSYLFVRKLTQNSDINISYLLS